MFEPKFLLSNKLLQSVVAVENAKTVVNLVPVPQEWEKRLKSETVTKKAYNSLKFVGNELSPQFVSRIIDYDPGRDEKAGEVAQRSEVVGKEKDIQMVINWLNANRFKDQLVYLGTKFKQTSFSEKDLTQINSLLMEKLMPFQRLGVYRILEEDSVMGTKLEVIPAVEIPFQMEDFFRWYTSAKDENIHPVIKAGVCFYEVMRINPYEDGNLGTAALFAALVMEISGFEFKNLWAFEETLLRNREVLWMYLGSVARNGGDMTEWLEFFLKCLEMSAVEVRTKLMMLIGDTPVFRSESGKVVPLTERQISIMEDITLRGETTIKEVRSILPTVSDDTILRDLKDLIEKKLIKKKGKTKGATYVLGKVRNFRKVT